MEMGLTRGSTLSETTSNPPPEPGFARREANYAHLNYYAGDRPTNQRSHTTGRKEGPHGGTRGSPVKRAERDADAQKASYCRPFVL